MSRQSTHGVTPSRIQHGLATYRIGSGDPILLMPGPHRFQIPGDGSALPLIAGLNTLGRQVITFDPPASGHSTRQSHLSMQEMHGCMDEALAAGISGPVDAFGHSMGGLTMLAYALERPQRVRRLVLVGTGTGGRAYMHAPGALWNRSHPQFWPMVLRAMIQIIWPRRAPETILNNFIQGYSFCDQRQAQVREIQLGDWLRARRGRTDWHQIASRLDYAPRLPEIVVPTLVLCGRHDPQYPLACSQELAACIPVAHLIVFDHSGHYPFIEEPEAFWRRVAEFLA